VEEAEAERFWSNVPAECEWVRHRFPERGTGRIAHDGLAGGGDRPIKERNLKETGISVGVS